MVFAFLLARDGAESKTQNISEMQYSEENRPFDRTIPVRAQWKCHDKNEPGINLIAPEIFHQFREIPS